MRIEDMVPVRGRAWCAGRTISAGSGRAWESIDYEQGSVIIRDVYHYNTLMVRYACDRYPYDAHRVSDWSVLFAGVGHGTVSDQGGMNKLVRAWGMGMRRDAKGGGARIEDF